MRSHFVAMALLPVLAATGCASRPAVTVPAVPTVASAVRCEVVFVEDASNDELEVLVPSRSLLVRHRWSAEEAENFHAWSAPLHDVRVRAPAVLALLLPSNDAAADDALWQEEPRTMEWVLPRGEGQSLQLFVHETDGAPPSLLGDVTPIGASESRVCVARQARGI